MKLNTRYSYQQLLDALSKATQRPKVPGDKLISYSVPGLVGTHPMEAVVITRALGNGRWEVVLPRWGTKAEIIRDECRTGLVNGKFTIFVD